VGSYLEAGQYDWRGISEYNSLGEKIRRGIRQFTPYTWTVYNWHMLQSFKRFLYVVGLVVVILVRRRRRARRAAAGW
jgi:phosphatidylserine synthase 2